MRFACFLISFVLPICLANFLPLQPHLQGNKRRVAYDLTRETYNHGNCDERVKSWTTWNGGLIGKIIIKAANEETISTWSATVIFDRAVSTFVSYDDKTSDKSGTIFRVEPASWNAKAAKGTERTFSIQATWPINSPEPRLVSLTLNGVPLTCLEHSAEPEEIPEHSAEPEEMPEDSVEPEEIPEEQGQVGTDDVSGLEVQSQSNEKRGIFVPWPKKVMGIYVLLADDEHAGWESDVDWEPQLYDYQQKGANVLFFTFVHPITMEIPSAFQKLAKSRGTGKPGAVPADTVILFAIGGYAYSAKIKPWTWLESKEAAEAMAKKVAKWPELYGCDGIDLDLEEGAGGLPKAGPMMVHFIRRLRELQPNMIVSQPTYGYPQVAAENYVINESWDKNGNYKNVADAVGLMVYEGTQALNYVKNYVSGSTMWQGFPIKVNVPSTAILLGVKGSASSGTIATLAKACEDKNYLGIMVWYASVKNGLQYGVTWDTTESVQSQTAFIKVTERFKKLAA